MIGGYPDWEDFDCDTKLWMFFGCPSNKQEWLTQVAINLTLRLYEYWHHFTWCASISQLRNPYIKKHALYAKAECIVNFDRIITESGRYKP